jgi:hypothetical protein
MKVLRETVGIVPLQRRGPRFAPSAGTVEPAGGLKPVSGRAPTGSGQELGARPGSEGTVKELITQG